MSQAEAQLVAGRFVQLFTITFTPGGVARCGAAVRVLARPRVPFLLVALGVSRSGRLFGWLRRHERAIEFLGGSILVLMGVLRITGAWVRLFAPLLRLISRSGWLPL